MIYFNLHRISIKVRTNYSLLDTWRAQTSVKVSPSSVCDFSLHQKHHPDSKPAAVCRSWNRQDVEEVYAPAKIGAWIMLGVGVETQPANFKTVKGEALLQLLIIYVDTNNHSGLFHLRQHKQKLSESKRRFSGWMKGLCSGASLFPVRLFSALRQSFD